MSDRDAFLRAIANNPADDTVRLAFADWLDEHDDHHLAEFIRVQIQLAATTDADERLRSRERGLLAHQTEWLGPLNRTFRDHSKINFRRGFAESAVFSGQDFLEWGAHLSAYCPVLEKLKIVGTRGCGPLLANIGLRALRSLQLSDWPEPADATAIAASEQLPRLAELSFWIGNTNAEAVCRITTHSAFNNALDRIELIQLAGGLGAGEHAAELDERANRLATMINLGRGCPIAAVYRPFQSWFLSLRDLTETSMPV